MHATPGASAEAGAGGPVRTPTALPEPDAAAEAEKRRVAGTSFWAALGITGFKLVVGVLTGSLGILAEAAHSGLDLVAAGATWVAIRVAGQPADPEHPYGHGKVENLSALLATLLLLVTCGAIVVGAIDRLAYRTVAVTVTAWSYLAMAASIAVDASRSRALGKAARKHGSQALEADALHFSTDIWSSLAVILGLACVQLGHGQPHWAALRHADAVAALLVAAIALWVTGRLGLRTIRALVDTAPAGLEARIVATIGSLPGVIDCHKVRTRSAGPRVFVDLHMRADGRLTLSQAHALTELTQQAVRQLAPMADVTVHVEPGLEAPLRPDAREAARTRPGGCPPHEVPGATGPGAPPDQEAFVPRGRL